MNNSLSQLYNLRHDRSQIDLFNDSHFVNQNQQSLTTRYHQRETRKESSIDLSIDLSIDDYKRKIKLLECQIKDLRDSQFKQTYKVIEHTDNKSKDDSEEDNLCIRSMCPHCNM